MVTVIHTYVASSISLRYVLTGHRFISILIPRFILNLRLVDQDSSYQSMNAGGLSVQYDPRRLIRSVLGFIGSLSEPLAFSNEDEGDMAKG